MIVIGKLRAYIVKRTKLIVVCRENSGDTVAVLETSFFPLVVLVVTLFPSIVNVALSITDSERSHLFISPRKPRRRN